MTKDRHIGGEYGPYVQSERKDIYKPYAEQLVREGKAYYCFCTKERLESIHQDGEFAATTVIAATCPQRKFGRTSTPVCRMSFVSVCRSRAPRPLKTPFTAPSRSKTKRSKIRCF